MRLRRRTAEPLGDPAGNTEDARRLFARRKWRRRLRLLRTVLVALLLAGLVGFGVYVLWFSSWLAVTKVEVVGDEAVREPRIVKMAEVPMGTPLARVQLNPIAARVASLEPVRSVDVTRRWPDTIRITITERTPLAVVEIAGTYRALDAEGALFRRYPAPPEDLPLVVTPAGADSATLREAAAVVSSLPEEVAGTVAHLEVRTVDQVELKLRDGRTVVWGSSQDSDRKAEVLAVLLEEEGRVYDVSVPGQPTVSE